MEAASEIIGAMGLKHPEELRPWHLMHRSAPFEIKHYGELYDYLEEGALLKEPLPPRFARACQAARSDSFSNPYNYKPDTNC